MTDQDELEWEEWNPEKTSFHIHMIAGSAAGLAEHVSIFPIDTLKTHIQCERCGSMSPLQTWNCATRIVGREGVFRLFRGVSAMFTGCIPAHAAYFSIFESMKKLLGADQQGHHPLKAAACGATATMSHDICMNPFDTVKQRMQLGYYKSVGHCFQSIAFKEGIYAFYRSLPTTVVMNLPYGCVMVAVNESTRKVLRDAHVDNMTSSMLAGSLAGAVAALITTPLDVVKTRLQTQNLAPCPRAGGLSAVSLAATIPDMSQHQLLPRQTAIEVIRHIAREEGLVGFLRGSWPRMLVHAPSVAISWTTYETIKTFLHTHT